MLPSRGPRSTGAAAEGAAAGGRGSGPGHRGGGARLRGAGAGAVRQGLQVVASPSKSSMGRTLRQVSHFRQPLTSPLVVPRPAGPPYWPGRPRPVSDQRSSSPVALAASVSVAAPSDSRSKAPSTSRSLLVCSATCSCSCSSPRPSPAGAWSRHSSRGSGRGAVGLLAHGVPLGAGSGRAAPTPGSRPRTRDARRSPGCQGRSWRSTVGTSSSSSRARKPTRPEPRGEQVAGCAVQVLPPDSGLRRVPATGQRPADQPGQHVAGAGGPEPDPAGLDPPGPAVRVGHPAGGGDGCAVAPGHRDGGSGPVELLAVEQRGELPGVRREDRLPAGQQLGPAGQRGERQARRARRGSLEAGSTPSSRPSAASLSISPARGPRRRPARTARRRCPAASADSDPPGSAGSPAHARLGIATARATAVASTVRTCSLPAPTRSAPARTAARRRECSPTADHQHHAAGVLVLPSSTSAAASP
jgi:hypothetical protein